MDEFAIMMDRTILSSSLLNRVVLFSLMFMVHNVITENEIYF